MHNRGALVAPCQPGASSTSVLTRFRGRDTSSPLSPRMLGNLLFIALLTGPMAPGAALAWTPAMDARVSHEALRLMPSSLRSVLKRHTRAIESGAAAAAGVEDSSQHSLDEGQSAPSAADRLVALVDETVSLIDAHAPFSVVADRFGAIAHVVGDLNNPLQVSETDPREPDFADDYVAYVEHSLPRYRLVFYGWSDPLIRTDSSASHPAEPELKNLAVGAARRAREQYHPICAAYDPANPEPFERRFDDRSLAFGIGSLAWSHTVTGTARVWLHVWQRAQGDTRGTPYLKAAIPGVSPRLDKNKARE